MDSQSLRPIGFDILQECPSSYILPDYVEPRVRRISLESLVWLEYSGFLPTYELVPVWCFCLSHVPDKAVPEEYDYVQYFNAVTGEYLVMD